MNYRGFLLFEVLIGVAVFFTLITGILFVYRSIEIQEVSVRARMEAVRHGESELDRAYLLVKDDFYRREIKSLYFQDEYIGEIKIIFENDTSRLISSSIFYTVYSKKKSVTLKRRITDPRLALGKSTCSDDFSSLDIQGFKITSLEGVSLGVGNIPTDIDVVGEFIFITTDSPKAGDNDLFIFRIQNKTEVEFISSLNTGPGLSSIHIAGNTAYVANQSINGQLQVIDIKDLFHPFFIRTLKLPGIYTDGTVVGKKVLYADRTLYLGTEKSSIAELHIFDASDPELPVWKSSYETGAGINALMLRHTDKEDDLFIAVPSNPELLVFDVKDKEHPILKYSFDAPGGSGNGKSLDRVDSNLVLGRTVGNKELYALTGNPLVEGSSRALGTSIDDLIMRNNFIFAMTSKLTDSFQVFMLATSSSERVQSGPFALNVRGIAMDCDAKRFFIISGDGTHPLYIISSS